MEATDLVVAACKISFSEEEAGVAADLERSSRICARRVLYGEHGAVARRRLVASARVSELAVHEAKSGALDQRALDDRARERLL